MDDYEIQVADLQEQPTAEVAQRVALEDLPEFLGGAFRDVMLALEEQGNGPAGPPFGRYRPAGGGVFEVEAGFPCRHPAAASGRVRPGVLPRTQAARTLHVGDYGGVGSAYAALEKWIVENGYVGAGQPWECYLDGPDSASPRTLVFHPCVAVRRP